MTTNPLTPFIAELTVESYLSGKRIDSFLVRHFRNYTSFRMQRLIRAGQVSIEGAVVPLEARVHTGQRVRVRLIEPPDKLIEPESLPLDILYEDPWLIAVNKPPDQVAHPVGNYQTGTLSNALQHHFDQQSFRRGLLRPGIVHRLDRMTSGVMIIAKEHLSHRNLSIDFQQRRIAKEYVAIVEGRVTSDRGTIDLPIGRTPGGKNVLMSAHPDAIGSRPARTRFVVLKRFDEHTLVRAMPETGRIHQIRVHLAWIGHPVLGDEYYGPYGEVRNSSQAVVIDGLFPPARHALHASRLTFGHPVTREPMSLQAPLPGDMIGPIRRLSHERANVIDDDCFLRVDSSFS